MKKYIALAALMATVSMPALAQTMDARTFRQMAAQADAFEIAASRMAHGAFAQSARSDFRREDDFRSWPDQPGSQWRPSGLFGLR